MFFINLIRYLQGYVWFEARGEFAERFLNLVARDRIAVWSGRKRGEVYTGCVSARNYKRLRVHAKKSGVRLHVTKKLGVPFQRHKYRKRTGLLVGLAVCAVFLLGMSRFIWRIEINGNETMQDSAIIQALDALDIAPGTLRSTIDVRDAERKVLLLLPDLSWLALNIDGSAIRVEVSESVPPPKMVDPHTPCNIVAKEAGQILAMNIYEGQALKQIGDTVLPGDIIVSGITQDKRGQSLFRHAQGKVIAQTQQDLEVSVPLAQTEFVETGKTVKRHYLGILGTQLPLFLPFKIDGPYRVDRSDTPVSVLSVPLPLNWLGEEYILMEEVPVTYTEAQAKALALKELALLQKARLGDAEILEQNLSSELTSDAFIVKGSYLCNMNIGMENEIRVGTDEPVN